jgi:predicted nucleic acid-binding protein
MRVVDASVAAKWFLPEHGTPAAQKLLSGRERLIAPALIRLEVAAAIIRAFRENRMSETVARDCCQAWDHLLGERMIQLVENDELHESAVRIGFEIRHSVQDCLYLAVGRAMKAPVLTADKTLAERGGKAVRLIGLGDGD